MELVSSCNPRYCRALIPLSTAVTGNPNKTQLNFGRNKQNPERKIEKKDEIAKKSKMGMNDYELTSAGGEAEETFNNSPVDETVVDGENMDIGITGGEAIKGGVDLIGPPATGENRGSSHGRKKERKKNCKLCELKKVKV